MEMEKITSPAVLYDEIVKVTKPEERSHWTSELQVKATDEVDELLHRYEYAHQVFAFRDMIDGELWYEIPFAYKPWWEGER